MPIIRPDIERKMIISFGKETTYGAGDAVMNKLYKFRTAGFAHKPMEMTDADTYNGVEGPRTQDIERWDGSIPMSFDLTAQLAGYMYALGLGAVVTTNPNPGVYQHTFTELATSQLPSTNTSIFETTGEQNKVKGQVCSKFTEMLAQEGNKRLEGTMEFILDGTTAADVTAVPTIAVDPIFRSGDTVITINAVNWSAKVNSLTFDMDNQIEGDSSWHPGGGLYRTTTYRGGRTRSLKLSLVPANNTDLATIKGWIANQTALAITSTTTGAVITGIYNYTLVRNFPKCKIKGGYNLDAAKNSRQVIALELEVLYDDATSKFQDAVLTNDIATYLV